MLSFDKMEKGKSGTILLALLTAMILILVQLAGAPPSPHNIEGRVLANSSINGVPEGTTVFINNTNVIDSAIVYTEDPGPPPLRGIYSATISGEDGNLVVVRSWNSTHYGVNTSTLIGTTNIDITLNYTRPSETNVTILSPANNSIRNTSFSFNLTANVSVFGADATGCNATIHFSNGNANITSDQNFTNRLGSISSGGHRTTFWNLTGIRQGFVNISVHSMCLEDGINLEGVNKYTIWLQVNDTTSPIVSLVSPENGSWQQSNVTFVYNVSESTGIKNCSLYFNERFNQSSLGINPGVNNFTLNNTPEGQHTWMVSCTDNSTNFNQGNSSFRVINVDARAPNITLLFPSNNSVLENYLAIFRYNVTDNLNVSNCSLTINSQLRYTNNTVAQNISNNFTVSLTGGDYNWSVNCTDNSNVVGYSGYFSIFSPDFFINNSYFVLSAYSPVERQIVEINATVFNLGRANWTSNISVAIYENYNYPTRNLLRNATVNITSGSNATVSHNYTTSVGRYEISVFVDPDINFNGSAIETNETNNFANRSFTIPAYNTYYGDIKADIVLDTTSNLSIFSWLNISNFKGTLFAADSDSVIDFSSLKALGRNATHNITMNDFEELDIRLNMTNLTDSINRSYTSSGLVRDVENFTLFRSVIADVPVVNTTNTSSFVTGIMWDTSDSLIGFYDGTQDVVFITKVAKNNLGFFGTYDYEIKIPANLMRYNIPNLDNSILFYREIT